MLISLNLAFLSMMSSVKGSNSPPLYIRGSGFTVIEAPFLTVDGKNLFWIFARYLTPSTPTQNTPSIAAIRTNRCRTLIFFNNLLFFQKATNFSRTERTSSASEARSAIGRKTLTRAPMTIAFVAAKNEEETALDANTATHTL